MRDLISISAEVEKPKKGRGLEKDPESMNLGELRKLIAEVEKKMRRAAADLNFEAAAELRDQMLELKKHELELSGGK